MGLQLHETVYGKNFFEYQLPSLIKSINRLADAMEKDKTTHECSCRKHNLGNELLALYAHLQKDGIENHLPCPRCGGSMRLRLVDNALSRFENIYICEKCGVDEAMRSIENNHLPIDKWYFNTFDKAENVKEDN